MTVTDLGWTLTPAAFLLLAAAAELVARWWLRHRSHYYVFVPGRRILMHPHPKVFPQLEPSVRFEVNREGERGYEVPRPRADETLYRALVIGGSQPEGFLLDQDTSWPGALQRLLERPDPRRRLGASKVHVGSIARSGVGSEALDLILDRVLSRYPRLQAIVVLVGASDVLRWLEQGAPPSPPSPASTSEIFTCHPEASFGWKPRSLALAEVIGRARYRWRRPVEVNDRAGSWVGKARTMRAQAKVIRSTIPDPDPMLDHFERHFGQVLRKAKANADRVLVVRQPWFDRECAPEEAEQMWHGGIGQAWKDEVTAYYSHDVLRRLMALLDDRAERVAQELDVQQLDLRPIVPPSLETYYDFFHLTPAGARSVAAAVATTLLASPLAADGAKPVAGAPNVEPQVVECAP